MGEITIGHKKCQGIILGGIEMRKPFTMLAVIIFVVVALLHVLRTVFQWEVTINKVQIPMWVSIMGAIVAGGLAMMVSREASTVNSGKRPLVNL